MYVAVIGHEAGLVVVADTLKPTSRAAVASLKSLGLTVVMLTGDNARTARAVADKVGLDEVRPEDKAAEVKRLQGGGVALGTGTDAVEAADITLLGGDLNGVATAIALSRATMGNVRQNFCSPSTTTPWAPPWRRACCTP